jgi:hypothetical protein
MNPAVLLLFFGHQPTLQTVSFSTNATWVAPTGVNLLPSVVGHGAAGTPGTPDTTTYTIAQYGQRFFADGSSGAVILFGSYPSSSSEAVPGDYCEPIDGNGSICYTFFKESSTSEGTSATTGASATGFGKTFAGGSGGAATTASYSNVTVTSGGSYAVVVPTGAMIQITYYA